MTFMFIFMFLIIIIAPFMFFLYSFRDLNKKHKIILSVLSGSSFLIMMIRSLVMPYSSFFSILVLLAQFYIITTLIIFILCSLYQLITRRLHKKTYKQVFIFISVLAIGYSGIGYYTHFHRTVKTYDITIAKETPLKSLNVAMISDVHLGTGTDIGDLNRLVNTFNEKKYDVVVLVGDIFDESTPTPMVKKALAVLSRIQTKYGIYAINGNHEHFANILDETLYEKYQIHHLNENYVCVDNLFNIVGREDVVGKSDKQVSDIIKGMDTSLPTIVLDHNPKRYKDMMDYADLQLSGHTHGGQAFPITLITAPLYDNVYGLLQKDNYSLIVSSGYGSWGFPIRFLTNCEYVDIKISFSKK